MNRGCASGEPGYAAGGVHRTAPIVTLREPPAQDKPAALIGRMIGLVLLLAGFGVVVWAAVTNQRADVLERTSLTEAAPGTHVKVGDLAIHVRRFGAGSDQIVLIHDDLLPAGSLLIPLAEDLAGEGKQAIVPDLAGFGFSSRIQSAGGHYSTNGQALTLAGVLDEMSIGGATLVGFGWGGEVAAEVSVIRPDLVTRLYLVDAAGLPVARDLWHSLEGLPFGLGAAVAFNREGATPTAEALFVATCPAMFECDEPAVLEERRHQTEISGTARAIAARHATSPAMLAAARLDEIIAETTLVAVGMEPVAAHDLTQSLESGAVVSSSRADLTNVILRG